MNRNRVEKIIEHVKGSPETMDYGRWGALNPEQRKNIKELCNSWLILDKVTNIQTKEIERLNNIINTMLDFNFFKEECPLNFGYTEKCDEEKAQDVFYENDYCEENCNDDYKKCWLKYFKRLQELKGDESNVKD